jgi:hypothetical protein
MIEELSLGPEGLRYVYERLHAGKTLSQCLVGQWSAFHHSHTLLPRAAIAAGLTDFDSGGKLSVRTTDGSERFVRLPNTDQVLCQKIRGHLEASEMNVCILEDPVADRDDPYVARLARVFFLGREVYHYLLSSDPSEDTIAATLKAAKSIPQFIGVLTKYPFPAPTLERVSVASDVMEGLARDAQTIFAGAYDGESYVIVER